MNHQRTIPFIVFGLLAAAAVALAVGPPAAEPQGGIDLAGMDTTVKPYEDFYQFANGKWLATVSIPADRSSASPWDVLEDRNHEILRQIAEEAVKDDKAPKDGVAAKVGAFYASGMDEKRVEAAGAKPLQEELDRIASVKDASGLVREVARFHGLGVAAAFQLAQEQDQMDSKRMIAGLAQGGLSLPDRDYYLKTDEKSEALRTAFRAHVEKMLALLGDAPEKAAAGARTVLAFETRLAKASKAPVDLRDPKENYHLMTLEKLGAETPGFDWKAYFDGVGLADLKEADLSQPDFFKEVGRSAAAVPLDDWKTYLRWQLLNHYSDKLSAAFVEEDFHFNSAVLNGVPEMQPRWKRVLDATDQLLGEALGRLYVDRVFPPEAKTRAETMVRNIKAALHERLATLDWMSPETRKEAVRKLDAIAVKIGYPSKWRDYSGLAVDQDTYARNVMQAEAFDRREDLAKIGKPTDPAEWSMTPPTINANYDASHNEIVFPAGILQPPFFDPRADDAVNYGAIGSIIGHELTHGFDDQGRQFDGDGNLRDWWTPADEKAFKERAAHIADQYDGYVLTGDLHVNGQLSLGENIADLGGLKIAYVALRKALEGKPPPARIDGFTAEQRYFLAFAQVWREKMRPEKAEVLLTTDPHSPARFRVLGALYNTPEFFEAFGASPEQAGPRLNPKPVRIW